MPAPVELCALEDVRDLMEKRTSDKFQDELISTLILRASTTVMLFCDRQFAPAETKVVKTFEWPWEGQLVNLSPYDLRKIYKVSVDTDQKAGGLELSTEEWRLWPQPARDGTYLSLRVQPFSAVLGQVQWRNRQIQIEGDWGFAEVPFDVAHATAATVVHWLTVNYRRPDEENPVGFTPMRGIAPESYDLLYRYKRAVTF